MKSRLVSVVMIAALSAGAQKTSQDAFIGDPLIDTIYTADRSAHVFEERMYVYPSHDWEAGVEPDDTGAHFAMVDHHVLSMSPISSRHVIPITS